jgi:hypothetical protein
MFWFESGNCTNSFCWLTQKRNLFTAIAGASVPTCLALDGVSRMGECVGPTKIRYTDRWQLVYPFPFRKNQSRIQRQLLFFHSVGSFSCDAIYCMFVSRNHEFRYAMATKLISLFLLIRNVAEYHGFHLKG